MGAYYTLVRREVSSLFVSWTGYVIIATVLFLLGISFTSMLRALNTDATAMPLTQMFYETVYFWLILLLVTPVITMRSFALEKSSGTYENLMTTPVGDSQVVLAKFTGALVFYFILWLPLLGCLLVVRFYSNDPTALDPGTIVSTYLGIMLFGSLYISIGVFASAITRSQIIAAMVSYAFGIALFTASFLSATISVQSGWRAQMLGHLSLMEHMRDFAAGVVDSRPVIFYGSVTVLFLFLTWRVVESRRWK